MRDDRIPVDLLVVGAGPAGLAAAIAARKAGVSSLGVLEREDEQGGILNQCSHNGFGLHRFREELTGPEYAQRDIDEAQALELDIRTGTTVLDITPDKLVTAVSRERGIQVFAAKAVILAMGCRERPRGALAIPGSRPAGVFSARCIVNSGSVTVAARLALSGSLTRVKPPPPGPTRTPRCRLDFGPSQ